MNKRLINNNKKSAEQYLWCLSLCTKLFFVRQAHNYLKRENIISKEYEYIFVIYFLLPLAALCVIFLKK